MSEGRAIAAGRLRAFAWFMVAAVYFPVAQNIADRAAHGFTADEGEDALSRLLLLFLLLVGYSAMGRRGQRQPEPLRAMGMKRRAGWGEEWATGLMLGWAGAAASVLAIALSGGLLVTFWTNRHQALVLLLDLIVLALATLTEEVVFRGYPFQRLVEATSPTLATLLVSILYAGLRWHNPNATGAGAFNALLLTWLLALAWFRTRALWVGWGLHFGWTVAIAVVFGLPIGGLTSFSPVVSSAAPGPRWITGGGYGPEGSAVCTLVLLGLLYCTTRATRDYAHRYAQPEIVAGGIPVDIDAAARRQHEAAMGQAAAAPALVQIAPSPPVVNLDRRAGHNGGRAEEGDGGPDKVDGEPAARS